jgi:ribosomal protein S20
MFFVHFRSAMAQIQSNEKHSNQVPRKAIDNVSARTKILPLLRALTEITKTNPLPKALRQGR